MIKEEVLYRTSLKDRSDETDLTGISGFDPSLINIPQNEPEKNVNLSLDDSLQAQFLDFQKKILKYHKDFTNSQNLSDWCKIQTNYSKDKPGL